MMRVLRLAVAALTAWAMTAAVLAAESTVGGSRFVVSIMDQATREWHSAEGSVVPLRPDQACFGWQLYLVTESPTVTVTEIFSTPVRPAHWPDDPNIKLLEGGRVAEVTLTFPMLARTWLDRGAERATAGWIGHGWCIEQGDPAGTHIIDVREGDRLLHRFCFLVIPDDADPTAPQWGAPAECGAPIS
ncbi:MAG TPA: hypothetical protein VLV76_11785 [Candidatus Acidoferrum sp.]|nr:hypothetical protein [Candidatus Acidoferrum sp.]